MIHYYAPKRVMKVLENQYFLAKQFPKGFYFLTALMILMRFGSAIAISYNMTLTTVKLVVKILYYRVSQTNPYCMYRE